jgi:hypothetical protein
MPTCPCCFKKVSQTTLARHAKKVSAVTAVERDLYSLTTPTHPNAVEAPAVPVVQYGASGPNRKKAMFDAARDRRYLRRTQRATRFDEIDEYFVGRTRTGLDDDLAVKFTEVYRKIVVRDFYDWRP